VSERTETAAARFIVVDATAEPETMDLGDGEMNSVSCVRLRMPHNQFAFVVEGRPEDVLSVFRQAVALAEENLMQTVRSPELRRMYGVMAEAEVSQGGTDSVGLDFQACQRADRHVRSTRHGRLECPFVKDVDVDFPPGDDPMPDLNPHDRAWHHDGGRCVRANTTHDCLGNHRYGVTFEESH
jgi:hypothetical protein